MFVAGLAHVPSSVCCLKYTLLPGFVSSSGNGAFAFSVFITLEAESMSPHCILHICVCCFCYCFLPNIAGLEFSAQFPVVKLMFTTVFESHTNYETV